MSIEFEPSLVELTQTGATAGLLLDAQKRMTRICVEDVLKKIDHAVLNGTTSPEQSHAWVHEIAAYRRIVAKQQQEVERGLSTSRRLVEESKNG